MIAGHDCRLVPSSHTRNPTLRHIQRSHVFHRWICPDSRSPAPMTPPHSRNVVRLGFRQLMRIIVISIAILGYRIPSRTALCYLLAPVWTPAHSRTTKGALHFPLPLCWPESSLFCEDNRWNLQPASPLVPWAPIQRTYHRWICPTEDPAVEVLVRPRCVSPLWWLWQSSFCWNCPLPGNNFFKVFVFRH